MIVQSRAVVIFVKTLTAINMFKSSRLFKIMEMFLYSLLNEFTTYLKLFNDVGCGKINQSQSYCPKIKNNLSDFLQIKVYHKIFEAFFSSLFYSPPCS